jgi:hypothetical protein
MPTVNKLEERIWRDMPSLFWRDMPSLFWIVPSPTGRAMDSTPAIFAHQKSAEDYARKQAQTNDRYTRVFKVSLHGTAIPQDSQFATE